MNKFQFFNDSDLKKIHKGTLRILESTGIIVDDKEAQQLLSDAGASVDTKTNIVKIPGFLVDEAIASTPSMVYAAGRGDKGFYLGDGKVRYTSFGEAPQIIDPYTQEVRNVTKEDEGNYARVVDALDQHDMCWDTWVASDVPANTYTLHSLEAYLNNTVKPVCTATTNGILAEAAVKMGAAVAGGREALKEKPVMIAGTCPKSPLHLDKGICESILVLARAGVPNMNMSALTTGGTGPVTLAGTIVVHNAEMLACILLAQLAQKGAPCIYGSCSSGLDLRKATSTYGCPEIGMFSAAFAQLAQWYDIPIVTAGFWTDSNASDMQCGHEKTLNGLLPALTGADLIFGSGCMSAGMIGSFGQMVADNEMIAMIRRVLEGVPVTDIDLALDVIEEVGPAGNFLAEEHTMTYMRSVLAQTALMDRQNYADWTNSGSEDFIRRTDKKALEILENHTVPALDNAVKAQFKDIIAEAEEQLKQQ